MAQGRFVGGVAPDVASHSSVVIRSSRGGPTKRGLVERM
jgi:hypothetical protein